MTELHQKKDEELIAKKIATELMPMSVQISKICNQIEEIVPEEMWPVPKFYDMLFIR
jgi:glutamine synthetase